MMHRIVNLTMWKFHKYYMPPTHIHTHHTSQHSPFLWQNVRSCSWDQIQATAQTQEGLCWPCPHRVWPRSLEDSPQTEAPDYWTQSQSLRTRPDERDKDRDVCVSCPRHVYVYLFFFEDADHYQFLEFGESVVPVSNERGCLFR